MEPDHRLKWRSTSMAETIVWLEPAKTVARVPKWLTTAGMSDSGTVFVAARVAGNELAVTLAAQFDGVPAALYRRHVFLPVDWLAQEYPATADDLKVVERRVREHFQNIS
jgi:hypothetical protein